jgi:hypothetical protein
MVNEYLLLELYVGTKLRIIYICQNNIDYVINDIVIHLVWEHWWN